MRPDPYKRERSRRYLAKQRAKYGGATKAGKEKERRQDSPSLPPQQTNLASMEGTESVNRTYEYIPEQIEQDEDYDVSSAEQLERILKELETVQLAVPKLTEPSSIMSLYEEISSVDFAKLAQLVRQEEPTEGELADLPDWFRQAAKDATFQSSIKSTSKQSPFGTKSLPIHKLKSTLQKTSSSDTSIPSTITKGPEPTKQDRLELEQWLDDVLEKGA